MMRPRDAPRLPLDLIERTCELLYGPGWKTALARDLKVSTRTVHRWMAGVSVVPATLADFLLLKCDAHVTALDDVAEDLQDYAIECLDFARSQA